MVCAFALSQSGDWLRNRHSILYFVDLINFSLRLVYFLFVKRLPFSVRIWRSNHPLPMPRLLRVTLESKNWILGSTHFLHRRPAFLLVKSVGFHALIDGCVSAQFVGADDFGGDDGDAQCVGTDGVLTDRVALDPAAMPATEFEAALLHHVPLRRLGVVVKAGAPLSRHIF